MDNTEGFNAEDANESTKDNATIILEEIINQSAQDDNRFYHDMDHNEDIGRGTGEELAAHLDDKGLSEEEIAAVNERMVAAGMSHDIVQIQLASDPADIIGNDDARNLLSEYLEINDEGKTLSVSQETIDNLDMDVANDRVVAMAAELFDIKADEELSQFQGVNEFATAVIHGVQRSESGVDDKEVLAEMAIIAGTIPFGGEDALNDLEERTKNANNLLKENSRLTTEEIEINNFAVAEIANRDIGNLADEDYLVTNKGSIDMLQESGHDLESFEGLNNAINGQVGFLSGHVVASDDAKVFHAVDGYPSEDKLNELEERAYDNIDTGSNFMAAVQAAAAVIATEHVQNGGSIDDPLNSMDVPDISLAENDNQLSEKEEKVVNALNNHNDALVPEMQDLAAQMVESLGMEKVMEIANTAKENGVDSPEMINLVEQHKESAAESVELNKEDKMAGILSDSDLQEIADSGIKIASSDSESPVNKVDSLANEKGGKSGRS